MNAFVCALVQHPLTERRNDADVRLCPCGRLQVTNSFLAAYMRGSRN